MVKLLGRRVLVTPIELLETVGSLILPIRKDKIGRVESVSELASKYFSVGDIVALPRHGLTDVEIGGVKYLVVKDDDILGMFPEVQK